MKFKIFHREYKHGFIWKGCGKNKSLYFVGRIFNYKRLKTKAKGRKIRDIIKEYE